MNFDQLRDFIVPGNLYSRVDHQPAADMSIPRATAFSWLNGYDRQTMRGPAVRYDVSVMGAINQDSPRRNPEFPAVYRGWMHSPLTLWGATLGRNRMKPYPIKANPGATPHNIPASKFVK